MDAYTPAAWSVAAALGAVFALVLGAGHALSRFNRIRVARVVAWATLLFGTWSVERLVQGEPAGVRMIALVVFALLVMKVIVCVEERARGMPALSGAAWLGFATAWLGMKPRLFAARRVALNGASVLLRRGLAHLLLGISLLGVARLIWSRSGSTLYTSISLLSGLSLVVHFGLCNLLAAMWRRRGVACEPLFRAPLRSENLREFWARRWNVAFSEMTVIAVFRPLAELHGRGPALLAGFALSGLLHELAISVPVRAGFGLPTLYFVLHGALVLFERELARRGHPVAGWAGRTWAVFWVVAPLPLLFHRAFLAGVVWPLVGIP